MSDVDRRPWPEISPSMGRYNSRLRSHLLVEESLNFGSSVMMDRYMMTVFWYHKSE